MSLPQFTPSDKDYYPGVHTCSRYSSSGNMFSENVLGTHHFLQSERVLKSRVPARTVPAGTRSKHVLGTNRPLSTQVSETKSERCETENMF